jgi:hypothetical protein
MLALQNDAQFIKQTPLDHLSPLTFVSTNLVTILRVVFALVEWINTEALNIVERRFRVLEWRLRNRGFSQCFLQLVVQADPSVDVVEVRRQFLGQGIKLVNLAFVVHLLSVVEGDSLWLLVEFERLRFAKAEQILTVLLSFDGADDCVLLLLALEKFFLLDLVS